jgi:hypothetical protein
VIAPLNGSAHKKKLKALFYAKPGAGKTTLVGSAVDVPEMRDVLVISAEGGELTMLQNPRIKHPELIDVLQVRSFSQLNAVRDYLFAHAKFRNDGNDEKLRELQMKVFAGSEAAEPNARLRKFQCVVIDSLTEINDYCLASILGMNAQMNLNSDVPTAEFKDYKQNFTKMQMFIRMYRDLDMHVLLTALASYEQDEVKKMYWQPSMTGQLSSKIQGVFDIVAFMAASIATDQAAGNRRLFVQPVGGTFDAKCRLAACNKSYFDNPVMMDIMRESGLLQQK